MMTTGSEIQIEGGNFTRVHNAIFEQLAQMDLTSCEFRCLMFLFRMTYGYQKKERDISLKEWVEGTGIERRNLTKTLNGLLAKRVIYRIGGAAGRGHCAVWGFNKYIEQWQTKKKVCDDTPFNESEKVCTDTPIDEKKVYEATPFNGSEKVYVDTPQKVYVDTPPLKERKEITTERKGGSAPTGAGSPPSLTDWQEFLDALCWVCYGHMKVDGLPDRQRGQLIAEARRIREAGHGTADLRTWFRNVWKLDWQWKKDKARPGPTVVRASIASIEAKPPEGFDLQDNPAALRPNGTPPPLAPVPGVEKTAAFLERRCNVTDRRPLSNEELKAFKERQERERQESLYQRQQQQLQKGRPM